jgi:hypothetical protein
MSAAERPKRWGVSRQAKGREFDHIRDDSFTLFSSRGVLLRVPGVILGGNKQKIYGIHKMKSPVCLS